jgi:hypothetical protein
MRDLFGTRFAVWAGWEIEGTGGAHRWGHVHEKDNDCILGSISAYKRIYVRMLTPAPGGMIESRVDAQFEGSGGMTRQGHVILIGD